MQWNPSDHMCVVGEVLVDLTRRSRVAGGSLGRLSTGSALTDPCSEFAHLLEATLTLMAPEWRLSGEVWSLLPRGFAADDL